MAIPEKERTPGQKRLAPGLADIAADHLGGGRRGRRREPNRPIHAGREPLKREIYEIERPLPRPPAHAMALVDQKAKAPDTFVLRRGDSKNQGPKVAPRPPGVILASPATEAFRRVVDRPDRRQDRPPGGPGALARRPGQPADGPRDRQPALAAPLRPGDRRHAQRLRRPGRGAVASRAARLAGRRADRATAGGSSRSIG